MKFSAKHKVRPSLIISTYNWPEALNLVLRSVLRQSIMPLEVIIADDGSGKETADLIEKYKRIFPVPLKHIWHEDRGFRLAAIRNKAIGEAEGNYIIQIDGDTFLHKHFIKDHIRFARPGVFVSGSRVLLGEKLSSELLKSGKTDFCFFNPDLRNRHYQLHLPFLTGKLLRPSRDIKKVIKSVRGCNMGFWKNDLLAVNGYNEKITGWGREDSELSARLVNLGLTKINLKFSAIQYHIFHPENDKTSLKTNDQYLWNAIENKQIYVPIGIYKNQKAININDAKITAIIPTLNEEDRIEKVIRSVQWADEILIIDSFSSDKTLELARQYGVRILQRGFDNFSAQKNHAIEQASHDWIFLLDADELPTSELIKEIKNILRVGTECSAFWIRRINFIGKKRIRFSGWQNDKCIRLFNKKNARYNGRYVHEEIETAGRICSLKNPILHYTYKNKKHFEQKLDLYARLKAKEWALKGKKYCFFQQLFHSLYRFFKHYILHFGFLDGKSGWLIANHYRMTIWKRYEYLKRIRKEDKK